MTTATITEISDLYPATSTRRSLEAAASSVGSLYLAIRQPSASSAAMAAASSGASPSRDPSLIYLTR